MCDLVAPGTQTIQIRRVGPDGTFSLPYLGPLKLAGMSEIEAEKALVAAC